MKSRRFSFVAALAALVLMAGTANAAVVVGGSDGWSFSTDGMVNLFAVYQTSDNIPAGVNAGYAIDQEGFRIKNGRIYPPKEGGCDIICHAYDG